MSRRKLRRLGHTATLAGLPRRRDSQTGTKNTFRATICCSLAVAFAMFLTGELLTFQRWSSISVRQSVESATTTEEDRQSHSTHSSVINMESHSKMHRNDHVLFSDNNTVRVEYANQSDYLRECWESSNNEYRKDCGRCWLFDHSGGIILKIEHVVCDYGSISQSQMMRCSMIIGNANSFYSNYSCTRMRPRIEERDISIYVMVFSESENFGGMAVPLHKDRKHHCNPQWIFEWMFSTRLSMTTMMMTHIVNKFVLDARMVYFRGYLDHNLDDCRMRKNVRMATVAATSPMFTQPDSVTSVDNWNHLWSGEHRLETNEKFVEQKIPPKWRFYGKEEGCCEWCTRLGIQRCRSWMSGPSGSDRCIMYTMNPWDNSNNHSANVNTHALIAVPFSKTRKTGGFWSGVNRAITAFERTEELNDSRSESYGMNGDQSSIGDFKSGWYLGSLLQIQPNDCHGSKLDTLLNSGISVSFSLPSLQSSTLSKNYSLPNCHRNMPREGHWIFIGGLCRIGVLPGDHPILASTLGTSDFSAYVCRLQQTVRSRLRLKKLGDPFDDFDTRLVYRASSVWSPYQCTHQLRSPMEIRQCMRERDLSPIGMAGDSIIRLFTLAVSESVFGQNQYGSRQHTEPGYNYVFHWSSNSTKYREITGDQRSIQQGSVDVWFLGYNERYDTVSWLDLFVKQDRVRPKVIVHNLQITHDMWHLNRTVTLSKLTQTKRGLDEMFAKYYPRNPPTKILYPSPLILSEREYHDTADRSAEFNQILESVFHDWEVLPVFEMSQARMWDSSNLKDGVIDGMHMSHNLQLELARVLFDFLCS